MSCQTCCCECENERDCDKHCAVWKKSKSCKHVLSGGRCGNFKPRKDKP